MNGNVEGLPLVELFLRASKSNPDDKGACPFGQKWFMLMCLLVEKKLINLRVTPVSIEKPPAQYKALKVNRQLPVLALYDPEPKPEEEHPEPMLIADNEEAMESLIERWEIDGIDLTVPGQQVTSDLLRNFNSLLRYDRMRALDADLYKLERHLAQTKTKFFSTDHPNYKDCSLAAKLQHIRVACSYFRNFTISHRHTYIWRYLERLYSLQAFQYACPADRDIILHYVDRVYPSDHPQHKTIMADVLLMPEQLRTTSIPMPTDLEAVDDEDIPPRSSSQITNSSSSHSQANATSDEEK